MIIDSHVHTDFSFDCDEAMQAYAAAVQQKNVAVLGFTEHVDFGAIATGIDYRSYRNSIAELATQGIQVMAGAEIGYVAAREADIRAYLKDNVFDFTIGSIHDVDGYDVSGPASPAWRCDDATLLGIINRYYQELAASVESGLFSIIGHIGVFKRHLSHHQLSAADFGQAIESGEEQLAVLLASGDQIIEINTKSFACGPKEILPSPSFLASYRQHGGDSICLGSDAHRAANLACGFEEARSALKAMGFKEFTEPWGARRRHPL